MGLNVAALVDDDKLFTRGDRVKLGGLIKALNFNGLVGSVVDLLSVILASYIMDSKKLS